MWVSNGGKKYSPIIATICPFLISNSISRKILLFFFSTTAISSKSDALSLPIAIYFNEFCFYWDSFF